MGDFGQVLERGDVVARLLFAGLFGKGKALLVIGFGFLQVAVLVLVNVGQVKAGVAATDGLVAELLAGYLLQNGRGDVFGHRKIALGEGHAGVEALEVGVVGVSAGQVLREGHGGRPVLGVVGVDLHQKELSLGAGVEPVERHLLQLPQPKLLVSFREEEEDGPEHGVVLVDPDGVVVEECLAKEELVAEAVGLAALLEVVEGAVGHDGGLAPVLALGVQPGPEAVGRRKEKGRLQVLLVRVVQVVGQRDGGVHVGQEEVVEAGVLGVGGHHLPPLAQAQQEVR